MKQFTIKALEAIPLSWDKHSTTKQFIPQGKQVEIIELTKGVDRTRFDRNTKRRCRLLLEVRSSGFMNDNELFQLLQEKKIEIISTT